MPIMKSSADSHAASEAAVAGGDAGVFVEALRREAARIGFSRLGIAPAGPPRQARPDRPARPRAR
jgi:hypothetical protein